MKIFCINCEFIKYSCILNDGKLHPVNAKCNHENNIEYTNGNWFSCSTKHKNHPAEINKNNDCSWYKQRKDDA